MCHVGLLWTTFQEVLTFLSMSPEARPETALPHPHSEPEQWLPLKKMDSHGLEKGTVRAFLPDSQGNDPREPPRILQVRQGSDPT